jgi:hypothetical protein
MLLESPNFRITFELQNLLVVTFFFSKGDAKNRFFDFLKECVTFAESSPFFQIFFFEGDEY